VKPRPATTAADGTFRIEGLASGAPHKVVARAEGRASRVIRDVAPPADDVELVMAAPGGIRGRVMTGGRAVESFQIQVERYLSAADKGMRPGTASSRFTSRDGAFELEVAEPGRYEILVTAPGHAPLRPPPIEVPAEKWAEVTLELAASATVAGRVTSGGAPVSGVRVAMLGGYAGPPVFTDAQGGFKLVDVTPGKSSISASKAGLITAHREVQARAGQAVEVVLEMAAGSGDGGIQVLLASLQNRVVIKKARGAARKSGLRSGDLVFGIDGVSTLNVTPDRAASWLRGPIGSVVRLEVERGSERLRFDVTRTAE
jgi:hypothetical protein